MFCKKISGVIVALLLAACAGRETSRPLDAGSGVNNGPGPLKDYLACNGTESGTDIGLEVRSTAVPGFIGGLLTLGVQKVNMHCLRGKSVGNAAPDAQVNLWTCTEDRNGEGLYRVKAYKQSQSDRIVANVTIDQIFPLKPLHIAALDCRVP